MAKHKPHKARRKGGRPAKQGERYPSGKLKPEKVMPTDRWLQGARYLLGKPDASIGECKNAQNPLDLSLYRGWITEEQHQTATDIQRLHRRSQTGAPKCKTANYDGQRGVSQSLGDASAWDQFQDLMLWFTPEQRREVELVVLQESWPWWVTSRAKGDFASGHEAKYRLLVSALDLATSVLSRRRAA